MTSILHIYILFRIVVDEDVVPGVPPFYNYHHFGSEVLIDGLRNSGSILINPSYVEKKFIQKTKSSVKGHLPKTYMKGLSYVKCTSEILGNNNDLEYTASFNINSSNDKSNISNSILVNEINTTTRASIATHRSSLKYPAANQQISQQKSDMVVGRISLVVEFSKRNLNYTNEDDDNDNDDNSSIAALDVINESKEYPNFYDEEHFIELEEKIDLQKQVNDALNDSIPESQIQTNEEKNDYKIVL